MLAAVMELVDELQRKDSMLGIPLLTAVMAFVDLRLSAGANERLYVERCVDVKCSQEAFARNLNRQSYSG